MLAVFFGSSGMAFAHQMQGGSTKGLFGLKPEYVHVLLNPLPVYGLSMLLAVICAASAWPVLYYGQHGYNHLYPQLDTESQQWLDVHMERAEKFIYAFYLTALLGIAAILVQKKLPRASKALTGLTLAAAIASVGIGAWISRAGGKVSHSEFRNEDEPQPSAHDMHGQSHDEMQMPGANPMKQ